MKVNVYEWGTNRHFEKRLVAVERDVIKVKENKFGWMLTNINNERNFLLKSQYYIVIENAGGSL